MNVLDQALDLRAKGFAPVFQRGKSAFHPGWNKQIRSAEDLKREYQTGLNVAVVTGLGDVRVLMVDPIVNAVSGDSHKNTETRRSLQPVVDLASRLRAAAIGISHFSKGTAGRDPVERVPDCVPSLSSRLGHSSTYLPPIRARVIALSANRSLERNPSIATKPMPKM